MTVLLKPNETLSGLKGVVPPLILPLTDAGSIDFESLGRQVDFLLENGVNGLWVNGTTGEFFALSPEERADVVRACVERVRGRVPVIAHAGDASTGRVLVHARAALDAGADGLSVVPPYYAIYNQEELKDHFRQVAREIGAPVFLYQIPQTCKLSLTIPNILELALEGVLIGIKDSAGDVDFYYRLVRRVKETKAPLRCFYGSGSLVDVGLYVGGHGAMCAVANLVPGPCCETYAAAVRGKWQEAQAANQKVLSLIDAMALPTRPGTAPVIPVYKWMLREIGVIRGDWAFAPVKPLDEQEQELLRKNALPLLRKIQFRGVSRAMNA